MSRYIEPDPERDERARLESEMELLEHCQVKLQNHAATMEKVQAGIAEVREQFTKQDEFLVEANRRIENMFATLDALAARRL